MRPGAATHRCTAALTQQELAQPVLGSQAIRFGIGPRTDQVTECLVRFIWNPYGREITTAQQTRQLERIASICLDLVTGTDWDQRRCNHNAFNAQRRKLSVQCVASWSSFISHSKADR